jgi:C-terminal processing protease CtpA/Prc
VRNCTQIRLSRSCTLSRNRKIQEPITSLVCKTAGRLLSGDRFNLGHGYLLGIATAQYLTWNGKLIERAGVTPDVQVTLDAEALQQGRDTQLEKAIEVLQVLAAPTG